MKTIWVFLTTYFGVMFSYVFFYLPYYGLWFSTDSFFHLYHARAGSSGIISSVTRFFSAEPIMVCLFFLTILFVAVWLLFHAVFNDTFLTVIGTLMFFWSVYPLVHIGIIDYHIPILAGWCLVFACIKRRLWLLLVGIIPLTLFVWQKSLLFIFQLPIFWVKYIYLKQFFITELGWLTPISLIIGLFFLAVGAWLIIRKFSVFNVFLFVSYLGVFLISIIMARFYLFLVPLRILYVLFILRELSLTNSKLKKVLISLLLAFILLMNISSFTLSLPVANYEVVDDLKSLIGQNLAITNNWDSGSTILYYTRITPMLLNSPDYDKLLIFYDAMLTCDLNESISLLDVLADVYRKDGTGDFMAKIVYDVPTVLILFPDDKYKLQSWEKFSQYNLEDCSMFWNYFDEFNKSGVRIVYPSQFMDRNGILNPSFTDVKILAKRRTCYFPPFRNWVSYTNYFWTPIFCIIYSFTKVFHSEYCWFYSL